MWTKEKNETYWFIPVMLVLGLASSGLGLGLDVAGLVNITGSFTGSYQPDMTI
jgi:hypothetical protein